MFKKLSIKQVAEILYVLLCDENLPDISHVVECFIIMLRESKKPKYRFKEYTELQACEPESALVKYFDNTIDLFTHLINTQGITQCSLEHILEFCITPNED